jgi:DNA-binding transcriptional regulator YdaS (Cro superfamily)
MQKLTLSVDPVVVSRAKQFAKERGVSVSMMVQVYLSSVSKASAADDTPAILRSVRGTLKKADLQEYRKHLTAKYR